MPEYIEREVENRLYAKTTREAMPGSCTTCEFGERYGCVGDVKCRILREYFMGNTEPPYKERPDECPLEELPAADVAPVVHARWEDAHKGLSSCKCSICGAVFVDETSYCPNCGAKMDLEGDYE